MIKAYYLGRKRRFGYKSLRGKRVKIYKYYWNAKSYSRAKRALSKRGIRLITLGRL